MTAGRKIQQIPAMNARLQVQKHVPASPERGFQLHSMTRKQIRTLLCDRLVKSKGFDFLCMVGWIDR